MLAIGCDHGGFDLKQELLKHLEETGVPFVDMGCYSPESVDYPDVARAVANEVAKGTYPLGVLICGTGIGISIAANKVNGIRAALCTNSYEARMAREHNDANILCMGGRVIGPNVAMEILDTFLAGTFAGGRHAARVQKITDIEKQAEEGKRWVD